jgi:hypothetical protein
VSNRQAGILCAILAAFVAAKVPTLSTPYYWDETLWISFAHRLAEMPLWRVLPGLQPPLVFGGRPPGLFAPVGILFTWIGPSIVLAHTFILAFGVVGLFYTFRLGAHLYGTNAGVLAASFLACSAMYFAQAGMFVADLPVTACGVASVYHALRRQYGRYLMWAMYLVLLKETALALVVAVSAYVLITERHRGAVRAARAALPWAVPLLVMGIYYGVQKLTTGTLFVAYAEPLDIWQPDMASRQSMLVTSWLLVRQLRWLFVGLIVAHLIADPAARRRPELILFALIVLGSGYTFSVLYFLPRYILPVAPFLFVLAAGALVALCPRPLLHCTVGAALIAVLVARLAMSDQFGNRELDLGYLAVVKTYTMTAHHLEEEFSHARIATNWPMTEGLLHPELGYVRRRLDVVRLPTNADLEPATAADVAVVCWPGDAAAAAGRYVRARELDTLAVFDNEGAQCAIYGPRRLAAPASTER